MTFPTTTTFHAGLFALIYVGLSAWVVATRVSADVPHGDGGNEALEKRIRLQGNFGEYLPFALLLVAFLEAGGFGQAFVKTLLIVSLVAWVAHPFGMFAPKNSALQYAWSPQRHPRVPARHRRRGKRPSASSGLKPW